jgi:hypothetical protein
VAISLKGRPPPEIAEGLLIVAWTGHREQKKRGRSNHVMGHWQKTHEGGIGGAANGNAMRRGTPYLIRLARDALVSVHANRATHIA